ncbi:MAG: acetate--CoA ligase family protein [Chloroflexi bacterium]|nr:acetate--CoA ligase family protein [Chloroflexota bacterium]
MSRKSHALAERATEKDRKTGLEALFAPRSVAVVGAARTPDKLGNVILKNIQEGGFRGKVYPINPRADVILGLRCYPRVTAIPGPVDLAVIVVPRDEVASAIQDCVRKAVRAAVVITAGFREIGPEGVTAEREVTRIARAGGLRLLGPNCLGAIDTHASLNATFAAKMPLAGEISFLSQSGALFAAILDMADAEKVGFNRFASLGNKGDVDEIDLLDLLKDDRLSKVVVAYLEGISDGHRFMSVARSLTRQKPLVVLKSGTTAAGSRAVSSHTGTLAGSDAAYRAAFKQTGAQRVDTLENMLDLAIAFAYQPLPEGRRLAIVTNAGGPGIMATDACEQWGIQLARFTPETVAELRRGLPSTASVYNPVDLVGDAGADRYRVAVRAVMSDPGVDGLLVLLTPQRLTDVAGTARVIVEAAALSGRTPKPVLAGFMGKETVRAGVDILHQARVPNYPFPERAVFAFAHMNEQREWMAKAVEHPRKFDVDKTAVEAVFRRVRESGRQTLGDIEARQVVEAYGLGTPRSGLAQSTEEAVALAQQIGLPVAMKIVSPDILHKTEVGGVRLGLQTLDEVRAADVAIIRNARRYAPGARLWGVAVQEMVKPGREVIVGVSFDAQFKHLLAFGLGGIYVEVLKDVAFRVAPITPGEAEAMIREIRSYLLLKGVRREKPADVDAIVDALLRVSQLVTDFPEIIEMDINPFVVHEAGQGGTAVDVRIGLAPEAIRRAD